jgi:prepilin-type processing-associated H-X9-DG protein
MKQGHMLSKARETAAFTVLELLVVLASGLALGLILFAGLAPKPDYSAWPNCVNNLKQVGLSFRIWAGDNRDRFPMEVPTNEGGTMEYLGTTNVFLHFQVLSNELGDPKVLVCRVDNRKRATNFDRDFNNSKVSYFIGLDADEMQPKMFLAGDRNLTAKTPIQNGRLSLSTNEPFGWTKKGHKKKGNVLLADGSVLMLKNAELPGALANTGTNVNRLLLP